jgi:methionyl-tRNA formyltransferase
LQAEVSRLPLDKISRPGEIVEVHPGRGLMIATGRGVLVLTRLQPEGRAVMQVAQYVAGQRDPLEGRMFSINP